jgi:hypothetical protein
MQQLNAQINPGPPTSSNPPGPLNPENPREPVQPDPTNSSEPAKPSASPVNIPISHIQTLGYPSDPLQESAISAEDRERVMAICTGFCDSVMKMV